MLLSLLLLLGLRLLNYETVLAILLRTSSYLYLSIWSLYELWMLLNDLLRCRGNQCWLAISADNLDELLLLRLLQYQGLNLRHLNEYLLAIWSDA
jgi:hypothetical protein